MKKSASIFIFATFVANFLNFAFNAFLGRFLTFEEFGFVTAINTFVYLIGVPLSALTATVTHKIAFLSGASEEHDQKHFFSQTLRYGLIVSSLLTIIWLLLSPFLSKFFKLDDVEAMVLFAPAIILSTLGGIYSGFLKGKLLFQILGILIIVESGAKFLIAVALTILNLKHFVYLSIPASIAISAVSAMFVIEKFLHGRKFVKEKLKLPYHFSKSFFLAAAVASLSGTLIFSLDVLFAKHYLSARAAGEYALLSLIGKMVFFFASMPNQFTLALVSRKEGLKENSRKIFHSIFFLTLASLIFALFFVGLLGKFTLPLLFGKKIISVLPFMTEYIIGISLISLSGILSSYHLARKNLIFSYASIFVALLMSGMFLFKHQNLNDFSRIILLTGVFNFLLFSAVHFFQKNGIYFMRNFIDLVDVFSPKENSHLNANGKSILIFNWRDTRHVWAGGAEVYIHELARRWVEMGHSVTLFCGNDTKCPRDETIDGVRIKRRGGFYTVYFWAFIYYMLHYRKSFDVIIDSQNGMPFFTPLYAREKIIALLHHVHQDVFRKSLRFPFSWIAGHIERKWMPFWYRNVSFLTVSESSKNEIKKIYPSASVTIVNPGVNLEKFLPGEKSKVPLVLYLGRFKKYKSIDTLIFAFNKVLEQVPAAKLIIAGFGEEIYSLKRLVAGLDIKKSVEFLEKVSEEEKIKLMQKAWVFVNPSMMEGWGITVVEANACGTPVVASNVPGLKDSVQNPTNGFLVKHGGESEFAEKIELLLTDKSLREKMSKNSVLWAKNFDWDKIAKACEEII